MALIGGIIIKNEKTITLGTYPYAATRVRVMKTELVDKQNYQKLMKMSVSEIVQFLQQTTYKKEVNALGMKYSGIELLEAALNLNSANSYEKILSMSSREMKSVVGVLMKRFETNNIKNIIRGKFAGATSEEIAASLIPVNGMDLDMLTGLLKKEKIADIILSFSPSEELKASVQEFEKTGRISAIENSLDRELYSELSALAKRIPKEGKLLSQFMKTEIDNVNMRIILRLKSAGVESSEIIKHLNFEGHKLSKKTLVYLANSADLPMLIERLEKSPYGNVLSRGIKKYKETGTLAVMETELSKNLLAQADLFLHQHPISIGPIIGFSIAKEAEVRNLRMIAQARHRGLPESFMEEMLAI